MEKLNKLSGKFYLALKMAEEFPEQEPEYKNAKWYHLLWLLLPIAGILIFILSIEEK